MYLLAQIMDYLTEWHGNVWDIPLYDKILWHAHILGLIYRRSYTQVEWTTRGIHLYDKYIGAK